ncbi:MAG: hypothetical protein ACREMY_33830, partial [bacterium]
GLRLEVSMRVMTIAAAMTILSLGSAHAAGADCLPTTQIKQTVVSQDERSITFKMKNGKTYVNTLPAQCRGLNLHGFTYTSRTLAEVCAGQGITLVQSGTVCSLGSFAEEPAQDSGTSY